MPHSSGWQGVVAAWGCGWLLLVGCQSPGSQRIIGPDGSPMAHVHCGAEQGLCFRMAGELCPAGYELRPVLRGNEGNFLVRCRAGSAPAPAACSSAGPVAGPPSVVVTRTTPGLMDPWPAAPESAPATYPWPAPETSAATRRPPSAPAGQADVDVGY